jgi:hypothetical protein
MSNGLMVRVSAGSGEAPFLERELAAAVAAGSPTTASFAVRLGRGQYATFGAPAEDPLTEEVRHRIEPLLASPAQGEAIEVLGAKPLQQRSAHVTKGLLLTFTSQPDKEPQVEDLLTAAQPVAEQEGGTTAWYALRMADGRYGIFDVFPDSLARLRHLTGQIPRQLLGRGRGLLGGFPRLQLLDVVAATPGIPHTDPVAAAESDPS